METSLLDIFDSELCLVRTVQQVELTDLAAACECKHFVTEAHLGLMHSLSQFSTHTKLTIFTHRGQHWLVEVPFKYYISETPRSSTIPLRF